MSISLRFKAFSVFQWMCLLILASSFGAEPLRLNLQQDVQVVDRNLELKAKKEELGKAEGRLIRANLLVQFNPEIEGETEITIVRKETIL